MGPVPGAGPPAQQGDDDIQAIVNQLVQLIGQLLQRLGIDTGNWQFDVGPGAPGGAPGGAPFGAPGGFAQQPGGFDGGAPIAAPGGAQAPAAAGAANGPTDAQASQFEKRLLELVNQERAALGLQPMTWNDQMAQLARRSAAAKTHTAAPEVLAPYGYSSPEDAMSAWKQSPGHWGIITDPNLREMGAGWVGDGAAIAFGTVSM